MVETAGSVAGGWACAALGAETAAEVGGAISSAGVGAVPGAIVGGLVGRIADAVAGSGVGQKVVRFVEGLFRSWLVTEESCSTNIRGCIKGSQAS